MVIVLLCTSGKTVLQVNVFISCMKVNCYFVLYYIITISHFTVMNSFQETHNELMCP